MANLSLNAEVRTVIGKQVKRLRREGLLPAVIYGRGIEPIAIQLNSQDTGKTLSQASGATLIDINVDGDVHTTILRDVQLDVITRNLIHIDFLKVAMDVAINTEVPLDYVGEAPAVKDYGAILVTGLTEIEIEALPGNLPDRVVVDLSVLKEVDTAITVGDLSLGSGITVLTDPEEVVAHVVLQAFEEEEEELEEEELLVETSLEPEVIERGKREDELEGDEGDNE